MNKSVFVLVFLFSLFFTAHAQVVGLDPGDIAPEIDLPDVNGNSVSLSSLRGTVVLVDFWASWCLPCIKEQPELIKLYATYPEKLAIFGVSLDTKKTNWTAILAKYKQPWIQVSDLKYWKSPVVADYSIESLPFNILIDKNGIILGKNLHGNQLNQTVKELLE